MNWQMIHGRFPARATRGAAILATTLAFVVFSGWFTRSGHAAEPAAKLPTPWKAGVAKVVVTPEKGVWLAGYGSKRPPDGKLHDLWVKALALEDEKGVARC